MAQSAVPGGAFTMGEVFAGIGVCTRINTRGLLETISVRSKVGCPPPTDGAAFFTAVKESTIHGVRNVLIDYLTPVVAILIGCPYYRLGPWMAHSLQLLGVDRANPLHDVAFFAATDILYALPTMPLCNSATHRILEEKPIEGVCLRLRSGPEVVSRTAAEHLDSATRSFRGLRMLVVERLTYHTCFFVTRALLNAAANQATFVPWLINYPLTLDGLAIFIAGVSSYPFELMRTFMVVAEMDEPSAFAKVWEREASVAGFWSGFWASVPRLILHPLHRDAQHTAELALVRRWGFGVDLAAELGTVKLPSPPGLAASVAVYRSFLQFGQSRCGLVLWDRSYTWPDFPASACGVLPLVGLLHASCTMPWTDVILGLSLEQYYTVFALTTLLQAAWKLANLVD